MEVRILHVLLLRHTNLLHIRALGSSELELSATKPKVISLAESKDQLLEKITLLLHLVGDKASFIARTKRQGCYPHFRFLFQISSADREGG